MAISNEDVAAYVAMVLSGSGSDAEKAATINAAAQAYGISNEQISQATGYSQDIVDAYLEPPPPASATAPLPSVSDEQINTFIQDVLAGTGSDADKARVIATAAEQYGISNERIAEATGYTQQSVDNYLANERQSIAAEETKQSPIASLQLKDAETGKSYNASDLIKLYNQIVPNLDTQFAGSAFGNDVRDALTNDPESINIGFNAVEAAKLFGQTPNAAQMVILDMARNLLNAGITDVSQIKKGEVSEFVPTSDAGDGYYQTRSASVGPTGQEINLGNTFTGSELGGGTRYALDIGADGKPRFSTEGIDTSDRATIVPLVAFALNIAVPGAGAALGTALGVPAAAATVVGNAIIQAGLQVASGVPVEKAIRNAVATAGVQTIVPNFTGNPYVDNAVRSVATAALTGQPVEDALANSLIQTGAVQNLSGVSITGDRVLDSGIVSAATSAVQALATGADVSASAIAGLSRGLGGAAEQERVRRDSAVSRAGFIGEAPVTPTPVPAPDPYTQIQAELSVSSILADARQQALASGELPQLALAPAVGVALSAAESAAAREAAAVLARYALPRVVQAIEAVAPETAAAIAGSSVIRQLAAVLGIVITTGPTAVGPMIGFFAERDDAKPIADALNQQATNPNINPEEVTNRVVVAGRRVPPDPDILISPEVINVLPSRSTAVPQPQPQPQPDPQPQPEVRPTLPSQGVVISVDPDTRMAIVLTNEGLKVRPATGAFTYDADLLSKLPQNLLPSDRDRTAGVDAGTVIIGNRVTVGGKDIGSLDPTTGRFTVTDTTPTGQTPEQEQNPARARGTVIDVNAANNTAFVLQPSGELVPVRAVDPATQRQLQVGEQVRVDVPTGTATTTVADVAPQTRPDAGPSQKPGGLPLPLPLPGPEGKDKPEVKPEGDPLPFPFVDPVVQPIPLPDIQVQPQPQPKPEGEPLPFPFVQPLPIPLPLPDIQVQPQPQPQPEGEPLPFPFVDPLPFPLPLPDIQVQPIPSPPTEGAPILPPEFVPPPEIVPPVEIEVQPPNIPETEGEPIPFPDLEYPPELIDDPFFNIGTPTVPPVEGEEITLPEFEEPPITDITTDINVLDPLVIRPATVPKVRVPPGTRLVGASQLTPTRVALSEEPGEGVYGTPEEEQQPVWNIRSLKLRKALRI